MGDLLVFVVLVVVAAVGGLWLGMLLSHRIGRLADGPEESPEESREDPPDDQTAPDDLGPASERP